MLKHRSQEKEQMDNFDLSGDKLHQTLNGLSVINQYFGNTNSTFKAVKKEIIKANKPLTIIDLGCGGGDNLRVIAKWIFEKNQAINLIGIDGNQNILDYAVDKNSPQIQIEYLQADILSDSFEIPKCDILISSHFVYHFSDEGLIQFLQKVKKNVNLKIIFSELQRSSIAYFLFKIGGIFLPFSKMVKQDGLLAIQRAFTKKELITIFQKAGIENYQIKWKWAFRFIVVIG